MSPERMIVVGRAFIAIAMAAFGVQHLVLGKFVTRLAPGLPAWVPAQTGLAYITGAGLVLASAVILFDRQRRRPVSIALGALIVLSFLIVHGPQLVAQPLNGRSWTYALKCLSLAGGALAIAATTPRSAQISAARFPWGFANEHRLLMVARAFLGIFMMYCCLLHFIYASFVATMVPPWIPGSMFWTYFTAVALFAGGLGILLPRVRRLAAALSAIMIFSWVIVLHLPGAITVRNANQITALFEALAFSGLALIIAGMPISGSSFPRNSPPR